MTNKAFKFPKTFLNKKRVQHITLHFLKEKDYKEWIEKQEQDIQMRTAQEGFAPKERDAFTLYDTKGAIREIIMNMPDEITLYDAAQAMDNVRTILSKDTIKKASFDLKTSVLKKREIEQALIGFALSNYVFDHYKKASKTSISIVWPKNIDKKYIMAYSEATFLARNLINIPANDMGPDEMEGAAKIIAETTETKIKIIKGAKLEKEFPLIHTVGKASPRAPRLIDISWGNAKNPKLVIVGKGVVFDTGGLDIKPSQYMRLMKKDMGGGAHALALAKMVIDLKLPVNLRVLVPCVENAVGGAAFRPGDIIKSRKGLTVENTNTDAEGRLILADTLTFASEDKPDLIIDFATLTGSARAALGPDIPAMFSNSDKVADDLQKLSMEEHDPLWRMPLWEPYNKTISPPDADLHNSAGTPGDLIYSALFLQKFLIGTPDWIHIDLFAWESAGRPGRAKGGTDMGLRAVYAYLERRYG